MLKQLILVGFGGGVGSIFRYLTTIITSRFFNGGFPLATFIANIVGCLILGACIGIFSKSATENENLKLLFVTGFCGGYTTFSTFAAENIYFIQHQNYVLLATYTLLSIALGYCAVAIGLSITKVL
jgi:CrcB protein